MRRYYFYAVFCLVVGLSIGISLLFEEKVERIESLFYRSNVIMKEWEETLRKDKSEQIIMTDFANHQYRFKKWMPNYLTLVTAIKKAEVMEVWTKEKDVYQLKTKDGFLLNFSDMKAKYKQSSMYAGLFFIGLGIVGTLYFSRKIKFFKMNNESTVR